jgi:hypothetical protein
MRPDRERFTTGKFRRRKKWVFAPWSVNVGTRLTTENIIVPIGKPKVKYAHGFWVSGDRGYLDATNGRICWSIYIWVRSLQEITWKPDAKITEFDEVLHVPLLRQQDGGQEGSGGLSARISEFKSDG